MQGNRNFKLLFRVYGKVGQGCPGCKGVAKGVSRQGWPVSEAGRRNEPSTEKPPVPRHVRISAAVKPDSPLDVAGDHAVEGQYMVVVVGVERTPEALGKGDGSELRVANRSRRARACVTECGSERPEEDAEHPTCHLGGLVQEGSKPLGYVRTWFPPP
jgi:hypothetical protein